MRSLRFSLVLLIVLVVCASCTSRDTSRTTTSSDAPQSRVPATSKPKPRTPDRTDNIIASMSVQEQVGQLIMTKLESTTLAGDERRLIASRHIGGIILFRANFASDTQLASLLASAQRTADAIPLLISVDQEGGDIRNVPTAPPALSQSQLAVAGGGIAAAKASGLASARALRKIGINVVLGPVADLVAPPARVMNGRSFGADPQQVAKLVAATVTGLQQGGVAAAVKHFPGFGASDVNTDNGVGHVTRTRAQLAAADLVPFRSAIDSDVDIVMVSHAIYTKLGAHLPATIAPQIIEPILRDQLGFTGVVMTDSMNATGLRKAWSGTVPTACVTAVQHGVDIVLLTGSIETARLCHSRLIDAVTSGAISRGELHGAVRRVIELKLALGLKIVVSSP